MPAWIQWGLNILTFTLLIMQIDLMIKLLRMVIGLYNLSHRVGLLNQFLLDRA